MPVSIDGAGRGVSVPLSSRSNSMNTLFQISTKRSLPDSTSWMKLPEPGNAGAAIDVDLRAAAARSGIAHRPEVVGHAELADVIGRHEIQPALVGLVVARDALLALEHGDVQLRRIESPLLGQEVPRQLDRVLLEVVAEREVAEHLEEGVMAQRRTDVVEIVVLAADPHALLRRGGARVVALLAAEEHVLELVHPGVGEEQRRIVAGQQGAARDHAMAVLSRNT